MRALVTGTAGLLGSHIAAALQDSHVVTGVDRHPWWGDRPIELVAADLRDDREVARLFAAARPDILFHCAALVNVDACERSPADAHAENAIVPGRLARAAGTDCLVVYVTTDGVFRGDAPYSTEDVPPSPRTVYGRSKLAGEVEVAAETRNHLIVRTNFYGWSSGRKPTFAEWLYGSLAGGVPITLFDDFYFTPIYVVDLVSALLRLVERRARGLFHLAGGQRVSKYEFGMELARQAGLPVTHVTRGSLDDAHLAAPRPKDMSLSTARAAAVLAEPLPRVADGIAHFLRDRGRPLSARIGEVAFTGRTD